jgi:hypothetical protein
MNKFKNLLATALFVASLVAGATAAHATLAVKFDNYADTFTNSGINVIGWQFTASERLGVHKLGYFDIGRGTDAHSVGLYNSTGTQIANATIGSGLGTLSDFFRMVSISPVELKKGETYTLVATVGDGSYTADTTTTLFGGTNTFNNLNFANVLYLNDVWDPANSSLPVTWTSTENSSTTYGYFGPNMDAAPVPEPGTVILVAAGLLGLIAVRRKQGK